MKRLLIALALVLAACDDQPSSDLVEIHRAAKARIAYNAYADYDYVYVPRGTQATGNCAKFAYTVWTELAERHKEAIMYSCTTQDTGVRHVYVYSDGWISDVRFREPIRVSEVKCI